MKIINTGAEYKNHYGFANKLYRLTWIFVWGAFAYPFPRKFFMGWKRFLLRLFGAKISSTAIIEGGAKIFLPYNLTMEEGSLLASGVTVHNVAMVTLGKHSVVSQGAFLCAGSHDVTSADWHQVVGPIKIGDRAWVAVESFVGMNVTIGEGAVIGARAAVFKDVEPWVIMGGNPAKCLKKRIIIT